MYANECKNDTSCGDKTAFLIFHSSMTNSTVQACPYGQCNFGYFLPDSVDVDDGQNGADPTAYALAPIQRIQNDTHPMVALYLSVQGKLKELYFANGEAWNETGLDCKQTFFCRFCFSGCFRSVSKSTCTAFIPSISVFI